MLRAPPFKLAESCWAACHEHPSVLRSPNPGLALTLLPFRCVSLARYCYRFDFSNDADGDSDGDADGDADDGDGYYYSDGSGAVDADDDNGSDMTGEDDDATGGSGGANYGGSDDWTSGDDNANNNDAWSFGDDDANDGTGAGGGIRVIVLGGSSDTEQVSRRLASKATINATFGCKADAADDEATWELFSQLGDGCYDMGIGSCGGGGDDDLASPVVGELVTWLTNELEIACDGLPCSLPFCAVSGVIYPAPTAPPTAAPLPDDGESYSYSYSYSYNSSYVAAAAGGAEGGAGGAGGILAATTLFGAGIPGWVFWGLLLLLLLLLLCCCCIIFLLCCGGGKRRRRKERFVEMMPTGATVVTVEDSGGAIARRQIVRGADVCHRQGTIDGAIDSEAAFNPMVLQQGDRGDHHERLRPTPTAAIVTVEQSSGGGAAAGDDFMAAEQGLGTNPMHSRPGMTQI